MHEMKKKMIRKRKRERMTCRRNIAEKITYELFTLIAATFDSPISHLSVRFSTQSQTFRYRLVEALLIPSSVLGA